MPFLALSITASTTFILATAPAIGVGCTFGAHVARDKYYAMDGLGMSGAAVEWAKSLLAWPASAVPRAGEDELRSYARMEALAAQAPAGSPGVFFDHCYREVYLRIAPALAGIHATISDLPLPGDTPISESGVS